jgi:hypothetical protein
MEYYLALKKNEILSLSETWLELEIIILSETSQVQKDKYVVTHVWKLVSQAYRSIE